MEEKTRLVTLHKLDNDEDIIWLIELDGVNTKIGINEEWLQYVRRKNIFEEAVDSIAESLAVKSYPITEKEKNQLNKLMQCMT